MQAALDAANRAVLLLLNQVHLVVGWLGNQSGATILSALSLAGLVSSLIFLRTNIKWTVLRRHGVTRSALSVVLQAAIAILLWQVIMELITLAGRPIPTWLILVPPLAFGLVMVCIVIALLWQRDTFSWKSVFQFVAVPLIALVLPFFDHFSSLLKAFRSLVA